MLVLIIGRDNKKLLFGSDVQSCDLPLEKVKYL